MNDKMSVMKITKYISGVTKILGYQYQKQDYGTGKVRSSTIGCAESICRWTIQTAFFYRAEQKSQ